MADAVKLAVRQRTVLGKKTESLRRKGVLPGVVFGGHRESTPIETEAHGFELGYRRWGSTTLLTLTGLDGDEAGGAPGGTPALIHGVSRDPVTGRLLHVDFERVSLTEKTHAEVPLHFVGTAPALKEEAVLVHTKDRVRVEAFPQDIPHSIDVDLSGLESVDDAVYVRDLQVDATKVKVMDRPDELVVKAVYKRIEEVAPAPAAAVEGAVPVEGEVAEGAEGAAPAPAGAGAKPGAAPAAAAGAKPGAGPVAAAKPGAAPAAKAPAAKGGEKKG